MGNIESHYQSRDLAGHILEALRENGIDPAHARPEDLRPFEALHTRGHEATRELAEIACIERSDMVLDLGCGIGGGARYVASQFGAPVIGIDLTPSFIEAAQSLTRIVGLGSLASFQVGSATHLENLAPDFTLVWTEHAQMNIEDKASMYREAFRVLRPGGRLVFHDLFAGNGKSLMFPLPWASNENQSFLISPATFKAMVEQIGFEVTLFRDKTPESRFWIEAVASKMRDARTGRAGPHLLMGEDHEKKVLNMKNALDSGAIVCGMGKLIKPQP